MGQSSGADKFVENKTMAKSETGGGGKTSLSYWFGRETKIKIKEKTEMEGEKGL